jgi:hypothetical protein
MNTRIKKNLLSEVSTDLSSILITSLFITVYHNLYLNYHVVVVLTNSLPV